MGQEPPGINPKEEIQSQTSPALATTFVLYAGRMSASARLLKTNKIKILDLKPVRLL
jgi:hypothetical protein